MMNKREYFQHWIPTENTSLFGRHVSTCTKKTKTPDIMFFSFFI